MKTFEEACENTFMAVVRSPRPQTVTEEQKAAAIAPIEAASDRYETVHHEVQSSFHAHALASSLMEQVESGSIPPEVAIIVAFSHGVMVGVEMEKP